jgi:hypothetical protein
MSFWDTLGGLFTGDTYFPDNLHRETRAKELARDCQNYTVNLSSLTQGIQQELKALDQQLAKLYGSAAGIPPDAKPATVDFNGMAFEVSSIVAPLVTAPVVSSALTVGATSYLLSTGEIGAAALAELVGLPAAFEVAIGAAAGVAAIGISFAVGAIAGAVKRDKLRDTIHQGVAARAKLAKAFLVDSQLNSSIQAMISALQALRASEVPLDKIMANLKTIVAAARARADGVTDATAVASLADLDRSRGSWTNEDS